MTKLCKQINNNTWSNMFGVSRMIYLSCAVQVEFAHSEAFASSDYHQILAVHAHCPPTQSSTSKKYLLTTGNLARYINIIHNNFGYIFVERTDSLKSFSDLYGSWNCFLFFLALEKLDTFKASKNLSIISVNFTVSDTLSLPTKDSALLIESLKTYVKTLVPKLFMPTCYILLVRQGPLSFLRMMSD